MIKSHALKQVIDGAAQGGGFYASRTLHALSQDGIYYPGGSNGTIIRLDYARLAHTFLAEMRRLRNPRKKEWPRKKLNRQKAKRAEFGRVNCQQLPVSPFSGSLWPSIVGILL